MRLPWWTRSEFMKISITSFYFALKRFEVITNEEFKEYRRTWNKYSKVEDIDIYGKTKGMEIGEHEIHAHKGSKA